MEVTGSDKHSSLLRYGVYSGREKFYNTGSWGLYYKTLRIRNLQNNGQILPQASAFLWSVTNTLVLTNTLAYYGIRRLQICNVFIVQAPGHTVL